jgi:hypothetical protein
MCHINSLSREPGGILSFFIFFFDKKTKAKKYSAHHVYQCRTKTPQHKKNAQSKKTPTISKNKTIYILFLFHAFSHPYRILTIPPTGEWCTCGEEEKHEEREKKEQKYAMKSMISWHMAMTYQMRHFVCALSDLHFFV